MKTEDRIKRHAALYGCTDFENWDDEEKWVVCLPQGKVWVESGGQILVQRYGYGDGTGTWKRDAARELIESMECGTLDIDAG